MDRIYLRDVWGLFWRARWYVLISTTIALGLAAAVMATSSHIYLVSITLAPTDANKYAFQNDLGRQSTAGVASALFGLSNVDKGTQTIQQFMELLRSPLTINLADKKHNLLAKIFREQWDPVRGQWIRPSGFLSDLKEQVKGALNLPPWSPPNAVDARDYLLASMVVEAPRNSSLVHVSIRHSDPEFAVQLLTGLYEETDALLRERERSRNADHVSYIQKALASVSYSETRQSLTTLLTSELGNQVLINSEAPYIMEILEPPTVSTRPVAPNPRAYFLAAILLGVTFGFVLQGAVSYARAQAMSRIDMKRIRLGQTI